MYCKTVLQCIPVCDNIVLTKGDIMNDNEKWFWHITGVDHTNIVYGTREEVRNKIIGGNEYGPYKTLGECKKDALDYHRCTIDNCRMAINDIKNTKLKELK